MKFDLLMLRNLRQGSSARRMNTHAGTLARQRFRLPSGQIAARATWLTT